VSQKMSLMLDLDQPEGIDTRNIRVVEFPLSATLTTLEIERS